MKNKKKKTDDANIEKQKLKIEFIPRCAAGELSISQCAAKIGCSRQAVINLKKRYKQYGSAAFIHGNTGRTPKNKRFDYEKISAWYSKHFSDSPFTVASEYYINDVEKVSYTTIHNALTAHGIMSPMAHKTVREKKKHLPRKERPCEGELIQIDGSKHNWFICGQQTCIHGAIDDATHKITALYMCQNECLLGYYEVLRQTAETYGIPCAIYSDRSACFFTAKKSLEKVSIQEQLAGMREKKTQWQETCADLNIELIVALTPQAKGRIERLWQTLQGRLPFIFRYLGITTIAAANAFLKTFVDDFNARFAVPAQSPAPAWRAVPAAYDFDLSMSVHVRKKTDRSGCFVYHGCDFRLVAASPARRSFTLLLNERYGLRAYMDGLYYPIALECPLMDVYGDSMPKVEKELIHEYFYSDTHSNTAAVSSAHSAAG